MLGPQVAMTLDHASAARGHLIGGALQKPLLRFDDGTDQSLINARCTPAQIATIDGHLPFETHPIGRTAERHGPGPRKKFCQSLHQPAHFAALERTPGKHVIEHA